MPTKYGDINKAAADLFNKNYEHGQYSLEVSSKVQGMEFKTKGAQKNGGKITSSHETTMSCDKFGKIKETFTPGKNALSMDWENSSLVKNTKFNVLFDLKLDGCPIPDFKNVKVNHTCDNVNLNLAYDLGKKVNVDFTANVPKVPFMLGSKFGLDFGSSQMLSNYMVNISKSAGQMSYSMETSFQNDIKCMIHNKLNDDLSLATAISHTANGTSLALAGAQKGKCGSSNQFKIDHNGTFAVSHITPTNFGAKLTVSGEFNAFDMGSGAHKVGAGLKFDL